MRSSRGYICALVTLLVSGFGQPVSAMDWDHWFGGPHDLSLGPEFFWAMRDTETGAEQDGVMYGGHFLYRRLRPNALYWAVEGYAAKGCLEGKTAPKNGKYINTKAELSERLIESRLGYTFRCPGERRVLCALFGGYADLESTNKFTKPIRRRDRAKVSSIVFGGLLHIPFGDKFSIELRTRVLRMVNGEQTEVTDDKTVKKLIKDETQALVDLPCAYRFVLGGLDFRAELIPFYRSWHFGGLLQSPPFRDTRIKQVGGRAHVTCTF